MIPDATSFSLTSTEASFLSGSQEKELDVTVRGHKRLLSSISDGDGDCDGDDYSHPTKRHMSTDDKKLKRIMANRRSARESRERRRSLLSNLESSVEILSKENASLARENGELRKQLARLLPQSNLGMFYQQHMQHMQPQGLSSLYANRMRPNAQQTAQFIQLQKEQQILEAMRRQQGF